MNKESRYKVSVIVPTFNAEKHIKRAINSVINQTIGFENIELILIDDKSTDDTKEILQNFSKQYNNIKLIYLKENTGTPSKPRNIAIKNSNTDYIMFLDQDDEYTPEMCEKMYSTVIKDNLDLVICRYNIITSNNTVICDTPIFKELKNISTMKTSLLSFMYRAFPISWTSIFKKSLIVKNNIHFPDYLFAEDIYFNLHYYLKTRKLKFLFDFIGYNYYLHDTNNRNSFIYEDSEKNRENLVKLYKSYLSMLTFVNSHSNIPYPDKKSLKNAIILPLTTLFLRNKMNNECTDKYLGGLEPYLKEYDLFTRIPYFNIVKNIVLNIIIKTALLNKSIIKAIKKILWILKVHI
ncbi:MAG: glycosyltransferase family 2 protein [Methanobrevibacter sp. CfCl-M3]